jgi:hypothetical protein
MAKPVNPLQTSLLALLCLCFVGLSNQTFSQQKQQRPDAFRQLDEIWPTPNAERRGSGAPGSEYWQQRVDYQIEVSLEEDSRKIEGREHITYHNHSPDNLRYLWVQLDNNRMSPGSMSSRIQSPPSFDAGMSMEALRKRQAAAVFDGGIHLGDVSSGGQPLHYVVNETMMRVDLPKPLASGERFEFDIAWSFIINRSDEVRGRAAAEWFEEDGNWIFELAHWFPRLAVYDDVNGWQNKQFLGGGEFALEFGDYDVKITVPNDHIVAASGVLQNPEEVMTTEQQDRWDRAMELGNDGPTMIVTAEEAEANESSTPTGTKTWRFKADNVRDFAWASSRKFMWDCWGVWSGDEVTGEGHKIAAMSFWPNEGEPLWSRYSTHAIVHTLEVYSRYTFEYPYPTAISVNGPVGGMEYPMICFNGPRPDKDGTYSRRTKYGLIGVIIHEVGHNYFPMIVNSDERQWGWMDEGLNTFVQYLAQMEWEEGYQGRWGQPDGIVGYMISEEQVPIMTNADSLLSSGNNAYGKPMTALNILRETVMGRELFDFAFAEYARRWKFKHPKPADFFRTMEDASAVDLDWFWHGWFYTTNHVDISVTDVKWYQPGSIDPKIESKLEISERDKDGPSLQHRRNKELTKRTDVYPELLDFYDSYDPLAVTKGEIRAFNQLNATLEDWEEEVLDNPQNYYVMDFENIGGLVMPVLIGMRFEDGTTGIRRIPAEVWRRNSEKVQTLVVTSKEVIQFTLDPMLETADADVVNNLWPRQELQPSRFDVFRAKQRGQRANPMRSAQEVN